MNQPQPLDLDAIKARAQAATDGPWYIQSKWGEGFVAAEVAGYERGIGYLDFGTGTEADADADREFVLNAHQDIAALLAAVERLTAERNAYADRVDTLTAVAKSNKAAYRGAVEDCQRLTTELATARAAAFHEAARVLEDTGRDDDAVNLLDNIAHGITTHAAQDGPQLPA